MDENLKELIKFIQTKHSEISEIWKKQEYYSQFNLKNTEVRNIIDDVNILDVLFKYWVYFKEDNFSFQWELQVWNKEDEENNINSHKKYKQDYTKWEIENKGGKI